MKPQHHPLEHLFHATKWSIQGLKAAWKYEQAFRIEVVLSLAILPLAFCLGESHIEKALMIASWLFVLIVELLNSAMEATVDRISTDFHELSGRAKDLGSAAVFVSNLLFICIWSIIILKL
ncbi:MAG: diacylglycerol kinase [Ghiorsea sp.]